LAEPLETRISIIEALAVERWADNWNFRAYLQQHQKPVDVDSVVHRLNADIAPKIDCTKCANCCRGAGPSLTPADVARAAGAAKLAGDAFTKLFLTAGEGGEQVFKTSPCPLLTGNLCSIYSDRPGDCRTYPHLDEPDFVANSVPTIENYRVCPIVFNVYERLKSEFAYDPRVDYVGDTNPEDI